MTAAVAAPLFGAGPLGWAVGGALVVGGILFAKKHHNDHNLPPLHDNHNRGNPNNKGPNGDPKDPFYIHKIFAKSRKDAFERAKKAGFGNRPINHGDHFHIRKIRGMQDYKFGSSHFYWNK